MSFIELIKTDGRRFLFDASSGWEIHDYSNAPAMWSNYKEGRNLDCGNSYEEIKAKLQNLVVSELQK